ncbi:MAG: hypothetical protein HY720_15620 [Planctomycetes bacterium]|nr:hypothetical protein [Planctomycetota bacterium]
MANPRRESVRRELWELILRYKSMLARRDVFPVAVRECDRSRLSVLAPELVTVPDRILDSKAYLQLSTMQEESNRKFLAAGTTPAIRMRMLARVVAALATPVIHLAGKGSLSLKPFEMSAGGDSPGELQAAEEGRPVLPAASVRARPVDERELERTRERVAGEASRARRLGDLVERLSFEEAEILSQLATAGKVELPVRELLGEDAPPGTVVSFVLKSEGSVA